MYKLIKDQYSEWYIIPVEKTNEAEEYFKKLYAYYDSDDEELNPEPEMPDWMDSADAGTVMFDNYSITYGNSNSVTWHY